MRPYQRLSIGLALLAACQRQPTLTTPASDHAVYAELYPERLRNARNGFAADEAEARDSFEALRRLPASAPPGLADELDQVVQRADGAGRAQPYVDEALRQEDVEALLAEDRGAIRRRIAGSVANAAKDVSKQKECLLDADVDALSGAAAAGTDRAVDRQLQARLRAQNPAHAFLRAHVDELGPERVRALERPVDALTRASFIAHVRLALYRLELEDLVEQEDAVRTTLQRDVADARAALATDTLSKSNRLALEEQVARDEAAQAQLDAELTASRDAADGLESREEALQRDYQGLLEALRAELRQRQAPAPKDPPASGRASGAARSARGSSPARAQGGG